MKKKASIANPNDAYALGIGMVHQHFMLVGQLTVLENIILGKESGGFLLNRKGEPCQGGRTGGAVWVQDRPG